MSCAPTGKRLIQDAMSGGSVLITLGSDDSKYSQFFLSSNRKCAQFIVLAESRSSATWPLQQRLTPPGPPLKHVDGVTQPTKVFQCYQLASYTPALLAAERPKAACFKSSCGPDTGLPSEQMFQPRRIVNNHRVANWEFQ